MDPLTQGVLGASLPQSTSANREASYAGIFGFLSGMAADLDVLIRSSTDPLLFLEYHRQFTHSLIFIPVGGAICALVLYWLLGRKREVSLTRVWCYCTLGYATHALLDACTTYGTMLFWPFSDARIAWNTISIIDPLFTLPLLLGVMFTALRKNNLYVRMALVWALMYMALGIHQRNNAVEIGYEIAEERGHSPLRLEAKPSFGNILLWKVVYETQDRFYVDAVRTGLSPKIFPGDSVEKLNVARDMPWLDAGSQQAVDIERFRWFSNGYVAKDPEHENRIIDIRYSMLPNEVNALWSLELSRAARAGEHAAYRVHRDATSESAGALWAMLWES